MIVAVRVGEGTAMLNENKNDRNMSKRFYESETHSDFYAQCRPNYPTEIIERILKYLSLKHSITADDLTIDIGCGTGQSTVLLAPYFRRIIGYDISESQVEKAIATNQHSHVQYKVMKGKDIPHEDASLTLIISGQAAHWFDLPHFYSEVKRTLKTNGVLALFGYAFVRVEGQHSEQLNKIITDFYQRTLDGYVQVESKEVYFGRYRAERFHIPLSSTDFTRDESVTIECKWSVARLMGYIISWSGSQIFLQQHPDSDILDELRSQIFTCLGINEDTYELDLSFDTFILLNRQSD